MTKPLLEKWECRNARCLRSFLVDMGVACGNTLTCPFCKSDAEASARQSPFINVADQLNGCLYPLDGFRQVACNRCNCDMDGSGYYDDICDECATAEGLELPKASVPTE